MDELYQQNAQIIYYFLYARCKDPALAEDLMQETFVKAMESLDSFDGSCKISTWLCQIAKHLLYQHWQRSSRAQLIELDGRMEAQENTERQAVNRVELSEVWDLVRALPDSMRRVVLLRTLSDLSFREIGVILGRSENWARVTFYRAKQKLMKEVFYGKDNL